MVIYQAVIETIVPAIEHADDSNGFLGNCIEAALDGLRTVSNNLSIQEQSRLFDYCVSEAFESRYQGWDWGWTLAQLRADLVTSSEERGRVFELLDKMARRSQLANKPYGWHSDYDTERAEAIKLSVIERLDNPDQIHLFLMDHFREKLVKLCIEQGELEKAKTLCHEWLDNLMSQLRGYQVTFNELLLQIAQLEDDSPTILRLSQQLLIDTGQLQYYMIYKKGYSDNE